MTDVTENRGRAEAELSAADEQLLRELTERARTGGLRLTGEGGLLGRLTNSQTPMRSSTSRMVMPSTPGVFAPRLPRPGSTSHTAFGTGIICQAGTVLLQTLRVTGLDRGLSRALGGGGYCGRCMTGGRSSRTWPLRLRWAGTSWPISRCCAPSRS
jgi:hypothetical protein